MKKMRCIDADALIRKHCKAECGCKREECGLTYEKDGCDGCLFVTEIENATTVDAEPVRHGRWCQDEEKTIVLCSECLFMKKFRSSQPNYCPNCGAKMDGDRE